MNYHEFLESKRHHATGDGFDPISFPDAMFDFQKALVTWATRRGRAAIFADCGLGKTLMELSWADNVARKTNGRVMLLTPLAVADQTIREAEMFGIAAARSRDGVLPKERIVVTNYERLHLFNATDFAGCVCDESSRLKNFDGAQRNAITYFMRNLSYRLLATATAAPNDWTELGTSSEALGELGHVDMLNRFFKNDQNTVDLKSRNRSRFGEGKSKGWRLKGHAEEPFWRWIASWARAMRKPSDLGFDDRRFVLPTLTERVHISPAKTAAPGELFNLPANGLKEERQERRRTINERCEWAAAKVVDTKKPAVVWCHLNDEGDILSDMIPGSVQVSGSDSDDAKEEKFISFQTGETRVLVIKPKIGAWGLNWQHCAHVVYFPSHSYEQYYQAVRRCWRFGQKREVVVDIVATEGDREVQKNMARKAANADRMFAALVANMNDSISIGKSKYEGKKTEVPSWLSSNKK